MKLLVITNHAGKDRRLYGDKLLWKVNNYGSLEIDENGVRIAHFSAPFSVLQFDQFDPMVEHALSGETK